MSSNAPDQQMKTDAVKLAALAREAEALGCLMPEKINNLVDIGLVTVADGVCYGVRDVVEHARSLYPEFFSARRRVTGGTPPLSGPEPVMGPRAAGPATVDRRNTVARRLVINKSRM